MKTEPRIFKATATREDGWWVVRVDGVGVTQARHFGEIDEMAKDFVAAMLDLDPADYVIFTDVPGVSDAVRRMREKNAAAEAAALEAAEARRAAAVIATQDVGLSVREAGAVLGLSHQRVAQLLQEERHARV